MLANEKIWKLLLKLSAPAMIAMIVQSLYNVVDTIFVGRYVGINGIAAIAIAFPIQMIIMAFSFTVGIGSASIISRSWGANDLDTAEYTLGNSFTIGVILSLIISVIGIVFTPSILTAFGASSKVLPYSVAYLRIILVGTIFTVFMISTNNVIRAEGNAKMAMMVMLTSAIINIILDPIFIIVLHMGIRGAAIATVIAKFAGVCIQLYYFLLGNSAIRFHIKKLALRKRIVIDIFAIGSSAFIRQIVGSVMIVILNKLLLYYGGDIAIAAYGVIHRILMLSFMPMFGIAQGLQPIIGFNYGAKNIKRVIESIKISIVCVTSISIFSFLVLTVFSGFFIGLFNKNQTLVSLGIKSLRIIILAFPIVGFQIVVSSMYQSMGKIFPAIILSMLRRIIFFIPLVLIFPLFLGLNGIWITFPVADILAGIITAVMMIFTMRNLKRMEKGE
jgi:putative MATE family efflux protein